MRAHTFHTHTHYATSAGWLQSASQCVLGYSLLHRSIHTQLAARESTQSAARESTQSTSAVRQPSQGFAQGRPSISTLSCVSGRIRLSASFAVVALCDTGTSLARSNLISFASTSSPGSCTAGTASYDGVTVSGLSVAALNACYAYAGVSKKTSYPIFTTADTLGSILYLPDTLKNKAGTAIPA